MRFRVKYLGIQRSTFLICGLACGFVPQTGCQKPIQPEEETSFDVDSYDLDVLWEAALDALQKHDLPPDRQDRAEGVIVSQPTTSQQWPEFWRQDIADPYSFLHANLHTVQRRATVRFTRRPDPTGWDLQVRVDVYQLSSPEYQVTTASAAIQGFSGALPTTEGEVVKEASSERQWLHLGRDPMMESRLMERILSQADRLYATTARENDARHAAGEKAD